MPYLQEPEVGRRIPYARSDHTISIPRPLHDARLGVESACRQCHRDQSTEALQARITQWYGALKPLPAPVGATLAADTAAPSAAADRILAANSSHAVAEVVGLTDLLRRHASPDAPEFSRATIERLRQRASSPDPEIRSLAFATLHLARGADPKVRRFLADRLRALGADDGGIRDRWAWILSVRGDSYLNGGDYRNAVTAYERAHEVKPAPSTLRGLGVAYTRLGEYDQAAAYLRQSRDLDPHRAAVWVELGLALMQAGDVEGATAAFRGAVAISPWDPVGYANLGMVLLRHGEAQSSVEALEKAVALEPSLADAHFVLANAYATLGQLRRAADALERGLEFDPRNAAARQMLDEVGRRAAASPP
ncbi:MAG: tetratricopeptide repeat protein [Gemmatimonadetes bacterium]|nr:tetratricopeptide repeat protein [Gemmatimonadota bacterium]